jgi:prepilin-type processing-associated H-X9-DG protein
VRLAEVTDGASNTLMVGERPPSADLVAGWWYAGWGQDKDGSTDMVLGVRELNVRRHYPTDCPPGPYDFGPGRLSDPCSAFHFWSVHPGGAHFLLVDGSVRFLRYPAAPLMPALATRAGGEAAAAP